MNDFGHQQGSVEDLMRDFSGVVDVLTQPESSSSSALFHALLGEDNGDGDVIAPLEWNFAKFLVNADGVVVKRYGPGFDTDTIARDIRDEL
jgi:glutathione peroxidase-family protein